MNKPVKFLKNYIILFRPYQYVKNLFIFAPMFFDFKFIPSIIIKNIFVFILFSSLASSVYIFNDLMDIEHDRNHPIKKYRPLASEVVTKRNAVILMLILAFFPLLLSLFIKNLILVLLIYLILNMSYSIKLKQIPIIDIFVISTGFVLRLFAGSVSSHITLSMWIIVTTFLLALFISLAKRRSDVILFNQGKITRKNIDGYNLEFVNVSIILMGGVVIVAYILYTVSPNVTLRLHTNNLYLTSLFVIAGVMRYMQITFAEEKSDDPTKIVLKDNFIQLTIILWLISFYVISKIW